MEVAALVVLVVVAVVLVVLCVTLARALRSMTEALAGMKATVDDLRGQTVPLIVDARNTMAKAGSELDRVDGVIDTTESIAATVDATSRLLYLFLSNPIIKLLAFSSGTSRAVGRFRRNRAKGVGRA